MQSARLSRADRLLTQADFERVFANASRSRDAFFTLLFCDNERERPRLGLAISRRRLPRAVARNRLKRHVRESFRQQRADLPPVDIVVMAGPQAGTASAQVLRDSLAGHWRRIRSSHRRAAHDKDADG